MKRALVKFTAQPIKGHGFVEMLFNIAADRTDDFQLCIAAQRSRTAAQAGAVSGALGCFGDWKEFDVLASRPARCARWPAVHSGRAHREDEFAVARGITPQHRMPAGFVVMCGYIRERGYRHRLRSLCE